MATIAENLQKIVDIKQDIKIAIENKGVDMTNTPFSEYSTKIDEITTGGGDTPNYPYFVNTVDEAGLRAIGWDDESISYFKNNTLHYEWQNDEYIVSDSNKEFYNSLANTNDIYVNRNNSSFEFLPQKEYVHTSTNYGFCEDCKYIISIPLVDIGSKTEDCFSNCRKLKAIPPIDTSKAVTMRNMFSNCIGLTVIPPLNTSNVTNMTNMFGGCVSLKSIPLLNTSNVTTMFNMFQGCKNLTTIPPLDTSKVKDMYHMFYECVNLTTIPPLDTSKVTDMDSMFYSCSSLQSIPEIDTSNVTTMNYMFYNCTDLVSLPKFNVNNCTNMSRLFFYGTNTKLKDVGGWENLKCNWNDNYGLKSLSNLTYQSCINIINGLYDFVGNEETPTSTQGQLKVHSNFITTATEEQIAVATAKGWTLTT